MTPDSPETMLPTEVRRRADFPLRLSAGLAALRKTGLTEAVHTAHELERDRSVRHLVELGIGFARELYPYGRPANGRPADKAFRDSLYEES